MAKKVKISFEKHELDYLFNMLDGVNARGLETRELVLNLMRKFHVASDKFEDIAEEEIIDRPHGNSNA